MLAEHAQEPQPRPQRCDDGWTDRRRRGGDSPCVRDRSAARRRARSADVFDGDDRRPRHRPRRRHDPGPRRHGAVRPDVVGDDRSLSASLRPPPRPCWWPAVTCCGEQEERDVILETVHGIPWSRSGRRLRRLRRWAGAGAAGSPTPPRRPQPVEFALLAGGTRLRCRTCRPVPPQLPVTRLRERPPVSASRPTSRGCRAALGRPPDLPRPRPLPSRQRFGRAASTRPRSWPIGSRRATR